MTGGRTMFRNTEYAVYHLLLRHEELTSRRIVEIMCDAGCGYFAPAALQVGSKMRIWGYTMRRYNRTNFWSLNDKVREPERSKTMPLRFLEYIEEKWPLNN